MQHIQIENIDKFMSDIQQYPRLTVQEEVDLHKIMHGEDKAAADAAREKLIVSNLRLVVTVCHAYKRYKLGFQDLVQEGCRGLVLAADKYDPSRCEKFGICAGWWIRQTIRRALTTNSRTIYLPGGAAQLAAKVAKVRNAFEATNGRIPTDEELAEAAGISLTRLNGARIADIAMVSTNEKLDEDSDATFEEMLSLEDDSEQIQQEARSAAVEKLLNSIDSLTDMEKFILRYTYGLGCKAASIDEIASEIGWCPARIKGRLHNLYRRLKEKLGNDALEA